jgi:hypothetical protein
LAKDAGLGLLEPVYGAYYLRGIGCSMLTRLLGSPEQLAASTL